MEHGCESRSPTIDTPKRHQRATIRTVAAHAGVSTATVSRALSGTGYVSPELQFAVTRAVAELGYTGNALAAALRNAQSNTVGMIVPKIASPLMGPVIEEVERILQGAGNQLLLSSSQGDSRQQEIILNSLIGSQRVDALIISPASEDSRLPVGDTAAPSIPHIHIGIDAGGLIIDGSAAAANQVLLHVIDKLKHHSAFRPHKARRRLLLNSLETSQSPRKGKP